MTKKTLALFPGQGSQFMGMGKDFYHTFSVAKDVFDEVSDATHTNIKKLCFEGPLETLLQTENLQPCLLAVSIAAFQSFQQHAPIPLDGVAGHSLGEFSALVANQSISLFQAAQWVQKRGALMQKAVPEGQGSMAAVIGLCPDKLDQACKKATEQAQLLRPKKNASPIQSTVAPANYNSASQTVVSGSIDAIRILTENLQTENCRVIPLPVSAPFHSCLMQPVRKTLETFLEDAIIQEPFIGYFPNQSAEWQESSEKILKNLIAQTDQPVLWSKTMKNAFALGFTHFIEFPPGKVLSGLAKKNALELRYSIDTTTIAFPEQLQHKGQA